MEQSALLKQVSHLSTEPKPVLLEHAKQRAEGVQNRIADKVTAFSGSMSWLTAITIFPQSARQAAAPCMPRHTSVRGAPLANCTKMTGRKLLSGSCITTRRTVGAGNGYVEP